MTTTDALTSKSQLSIGTSSGLRHVCTIMNVTKSVRGSTVLGGVAEYAGLAIKSNKASLPAAALQQVVHISRPTFACAQRSGGGTSGSYLPLITGSCLDPSRTGARQEGRSCRVGRDMPGVEAGRTPGSRLEDSFAVARQLDVCSSRLTIILIIPKRCGVRITESGPRERQLPERARANISLSTTIAGPISSLSRTYDGTPLKSSMDAPPSVRLAYSVDAETEIGTASDN
jgi:hypothetical protein